MMVLIRSQHSSWLSEHDFWTPRTLGLIWIGASP